VRALDAAWALAPHGLTAGFGLWLALVCLARWRVQQAQLDVTAAMGERVLVVPHGGGGVVVDGDADDGAWTASPGPARTGLLVGPSGERVTPASEARLLWGDGHLYVLLYAADEDIRSRGDFFHLTLTREPGPPGAFAFDVAPAGTTPDGVHLAREIDGTIDDARDRDEEWVVEMAVPLALAGIEARRGEAFGFSVRRGEAAWAGRVVLE
jgi:hypothetical protein